MLRSIKVRDWMSRPAIQVTPETSVSEAHRLMVELKIRRLPVMQGADLVGIVTIGDIREAEPSDATSLSVWEINSLWVRLTVCEIMTREVITVGLDDSVFDAAQIMLEHRIGGLPVVGAVGNVVGILTESDIFRLVMRLHEEQLAAS